MAENIFDEIVSDEDIRRSETGNASVDIGSLYEVAVPVTADYNPAWGLVEGEGTHAAMPLDVRESFGAYVQGAAKVPDEYPLGVDVSHWQGRIDWRAMKARGVSFAMLKATEGAGYKDSRLWENVDGCATNGIAFGFYHFVRPSVSAKKQFENIVSVIESIPGEVVSTAFPFALDCEVHDGAKPDLVTSVIQNISKLYSAKYGHLPMIYTSQSFGNTYLLPWSGWKAHQLWVANWDVASPNLPKHWSGEQWFMWQFSRHPGGLYGVESTLVDVNYLSAGITPEPPTPPVGMPAYIDVELKTQVNGVGYSGTARLGKI